MKIGINIFINMLTVLFYKRYSQELVQNFSCFSKIKQYIISFLFALFVLMGNSQDNKIKSIHNEIQRINRNANINIEGHVYDFCSSDSQLLIGNLILKRKGDKTEIIFTSNNNNLNNKFNIYKNYPVEISWAAINYPSDSVIIVKSFIIGCPSRNQLTLQELKEVDNLAENAIKNIRDFIIIRLDNLIFNVDTKTIN